MDDQFGSSDQPIRTPEEDKLGRAPFALALARYLATVPADDGHVTALLGPWGSGKTSILYLVRGFLATMGSEEEPIVLLDFNPWLFSGTEQVVTAFLREISAQLGSAKDKRLQQVADTLVAYGTTLQPF